MRQKVLEKKIKKELKREEAVAEIRRQGRKRPWVDVNLPVFNIRSSKTPFMFPAQRTAHQFNAHPFWLHSVCDILGCHQTPHLVWSGQNAPAWYLWSSWSVISEEETCAARCPCLLGQPALLCSLAYWHLFWIQSFPCCHPFSKVEPQAQEVVGSHSESWLLPWTSWQASPELWHCKHQFRITPGHNKWNIQHTRLRKAAGIATLYFCVIRVHSCLGKLIGHFFSHFLQYSWTKLEFR